MVRGCQPEVGGREEMEAEFVSPGEPVRPARGLVAVGFMDRQEVGHLQNATLHSLQLIARSGG